MVPTLIILLVLLGGAGLLLGWYLIVRPREPKEEPTWHLKCPHCRRRLGFKAHQAGHKVRCPGCHKNLTFPKEEPKPIPKKHV
jgi:hypothetical protein